MAHLVSRAGVAMKRLALLITLAIALAGCGNPTADPTTTSLAVTPTTVDSPTTTAITPSGPIPLPSGGLLEPGEYTSTAFEPTVVFRLDRKHATAPHQTDRYVGFQNRIPKHRQGQDPYRGVILHNIWFGLTPDELLAEVAKNQHLELGPPHNSEVAGFPATVIDGTVSNRVGLYEIRDEELPPTLAIWLLDAGSVLRVIAVDTPAGTVMITINAMPDDWEDFLPVADEILAGISFPGLD